METCAERTSWKHVSRHAGRRFLGVEHASLLDKQMAAPSSNDEIVAFADSKNLSARERDVLRLVVEGKSNGEIAAALS